MWAHPRVCGENLIIRTMEIPVAGSSPRVRGKHPDGLEVYPTKRLIPACAGKTIQVFTRSRCRTAHPRVCGENVRVNIACRSSAGSSPRVRGKLCGDRDLAERDGLIPACAGKTAPYAGSQGHRWAHPRVCGENEHSREVAGIPWGSSPRVRGKLSRRSLRSSSTRLIPACAGKTHVGDGAGENLGAHPRVCGENKTQVLKAHFGDGSSPRVRGKRRRRHQEVHQGGLIPACAGKTAVLVVRVV